MRTRHPSSAASRWPLMRATIDCARIILLARKHPPSFTVSLISNEGSGAPKGARVHRHPFVSGPMTQVRASPRREAFTVCAPGDARLSALHRGGLLASEPAWAIPRGVAHERCPSVRHGCVHTVPPVVAEGRCCSGASRASVCMHRLAGRRIPPCLSNASRKHPRRTGRGKGRRAPKIDQGIIS